MRPAVGTPDNWCVVDVLTAQGGHVMSMVRSLASTMVCVQSRPSLSACWRTKGDIQRREDVTQHGGSVHGLSSGGAREGRAQTLKGSENAKRSRRRKALEGGRENLVVNSCGTRERYDSSLWWSPGAVCEGWYYWR